MVVAILVVLVVIVKVVVLVVIVFVDVLVVIVVVVVVEVLLVNVANGLVLFCKLKSTITIIRLIIRLYFIFLLSLNVFNK